MKSIRWFFFILFAIVIGVYPLVYLFFDMSQGLLASKSPALLSDKLWSTLFFVHITTGGLALAIGWSQFAKRFRERYLKTHRTIGKVYLIAVFLSGVSGFYIALFATGGLVAVLGFAGLAIAWVFTTAKAYSTIRKMNIGAHERWMIRSYALCFAAVTLRIWLPLFQFGFAIDFFVAYRIIAWLCWVPNLFVAEMIVRNNKTRMLKSTS